MSRIQSNDDSFLDPNFERVVAVTEGMPSPDEFRTAQNKDKQLQDWIEKHSKNDSKFKPKLSPCADAQNTLVWTDGSTNPPKILVPTKYQRNVFDYFHGISHMGIQSLLQIVGTNSLLAKPTKRHTSLDKNMPKLPKKQSNKTYNYLLATTT